MLRRIVHITLSFWLSLLLLFGGTAKEFIHLFTGHEDTVHHVHADGELSFENEHHHCTFLSFWLTPFIHQQQPLLVFPEAQEFSGYTEAALCSLGHPSFRATALRGPPAYC